MADLMRVELNHRLCWSHRTVIRSREPLPILDIGERFSI